MRQIGLLGNARNRTLAAVIGCLCVWGVTLGLTTPLLSLILESRGVDSAWIGLTAAIGAISTLVVSPLVPRMMTGLGVRRFLLSCLALDLVFFLLLPVFDELYAWMILRFCMGATGSGLFIASETWINEIAYEQSRGRIIAVYNAVLAGTVALGPVIIAVAGIEGWTPFVVGALFIAAAAVPIRWATETSGVGTHEKSTFGVIRFFRIALIIASAVLLFAFLESTTLGLLPVFGVRSGLSQSTAAIMITVLLVGRIALQFPIGAFADRVDRDALMMSCVVCAGIAAAVLPLAMGNEVILWLVLFLWGGFLGGINTVAITLIGQRFRGMELATATAGAGVLWGIGSLLGPVLTGVAMDLYDPDGFVVVSVLACLAVGLLKIPGIARRIA